MRLRAQWGQLLGLGLTLIALICVLIWIYTGSLDHELIFDDARLLDGIIKLGEAYLLQPAFRSLWVASFHWVYEWMGADWRWQRALNIGLHVANTIILWGLTFRLLKRSSPIAEEVQQTRFVWAATVGVVVWAFNPVASYAVVYLVQRSTLLATFFAVCVMLAFIEAMRQGGWLNGRRGYW